MFIDQLEYPEKHKNEIGALPDSLYRQSFSLAFPLVYAVPAQIDEYFMLFSAFQNDKLLLFFCAISSPVT